MVYFDGCRAISNASSEKLLHRLRQDGIQATQIDGHYRHFLLTTNRLTDDDWAVIEQLLTYGEPAQLDPPELDDGSELIQVLIKPRKGTISPWSTKATDIAQHCGLEKIKRIERGRILQITLDAALPSTGLTQLFGHLYDPMLEDITLLEDDADAARQLFEARTRPTMEPVDILGKGIAALESLNSSLGLALSEGECSYLYDSFKQQQRNPSDAEIMMFAQVNSEHCRHKIFKASWNIDGEAQSASLFDHIKATFTKQPANVISAYKDNGAIINGGPAQRLLVDPHNRTYRYVEENNAVVIKVETHNHPTAIAPFPGAATGSGGEIRDEGATGTGAQPKAGLVGFMTSHLRLPGVHQPWEEQSAPRPEHLASALEIMTEGPLGASSYNNEFGRPAITGLFRSFEQPAPEPGHHRGYHKPIMLAGGLGSIRQSSIEKNPYQAGAAIVVLGGPAMVIGLGGGALSSHSNGSADLDFASVQRDNPEMQRRCQEVITSCSSLGSKNPIAFIHDVGAGGLSNAVPEILNDSGLGGEIHLDQVLIDDPAMSPLEIWCNESQERYVLAIEEADLARFKAIAHREGCPYAVIGTAQGGDNPHLTVRHKDYQEAVVDLPMRVLFNDPPQLHRQETSYPHTYPAWDGPGQDHSVENALRQVLQLPTIGDKTFLVTIGDRSVGGLIHRDQMVGPWQVPLADVGVSLRDFHGHGGEAMAMGERTPVALLDAGASVRLAIAEALLNLHAAPVPHLDKVKFSANWQAAPDYEKDGARLYEAVAAASAFCQELGITIPVGKDSLSMQVRGSDDQGPYQVVSPVSLVISAFSPLDDVRSTWTPDIKKLNEPSSLWWVDLSKVDSGLGASSLAQANSTLGHRPADSVDSTTLRQALQLLQELHRDPQSPVVAYHDCSDGGVLVSMVEMALAGRCGLRLEVPAELRDRDHWLTLFQEGPGFVVQVADSQQPAWQQKISQAGLATRLHRWGSCEHSSKPRVNLVNGDTVLVDLDYSQLRQDWSVTTHQMQRLRDNPGLADAEHSSRLDPQDPGISCQLSFDPSELPNISKGQQPRVAILREQGVNGQMEMAAAFERAGFKCTDVTMSDLAASRASLSDFIGLAVCGGFSYGDVLGAGLGWAKSILHNARLRDHFSSFFNRQDTFTLGICNGCQTLAGLHQLIPGASQWPAFKANRSERYEARLSLVKIAPSPSIFLNEMEGSILPVVVAHGEGRAEHASGHVALRYVDHQHQVTESYPANPNGSPQGAAGFCSADGRATILMPHPERVFRSHQLSYCPPEWRQNDDSPWMRFFRNARAWVE